MGSAADFADARARAAALAGRTSFRIGGVPDLLFEPTTVAEVAEVVVACKAARVPLRVLGGGCNLLVADGPLPGAVLATTRLRHERVLDDRVEVQRAIEMRKVLAISALELHLGLQPVQANREHVSAREQQGPHGHGGRSRSP